MNTRLPALAAGLALFLTAMAFGPAANAASAGSAQAGCTMTSASADAVGGTPSASAHMNGKQATDNHWSNADNAHEDVTGDGGSSASADNGTFRDSCSAGNTGGCAGIGGADRLKILAFTSSADTTNAAPTTQQTDYNGFIGYVPALSGFWFFGTVSHDGVMMPFATPVPSSGTLALTPTTQNAMAPFALNVVDCMPVGVGLVSVH
jgi:hypothetical protein